MRSLTRVPWWVWLIFALVLVGVFEADASLAIRLILLAVIAAGGWLMLRSGLRMVAQRREPVVEISTRELTVGEPFTVRVAPPAGAPTNLRALTTRLICRESASSSPHGQRQRATDVHEYVVAEVPWEGAGSSAELRIPDDAMHSFTSRNHEVAWAIEVEARARDGWQGKKKVELTVLPAVYEG